MLNASPKLLKHFAMVGTLAATAWLGTAFAQTDTPSSPSTTPATPTSTTPGTNPVTTPGAAGPATGHETHSMEDYLTNHPDVADQLHKDPSLINNPQWLAQHPKVQSYMNSHPNLKADAAANPQQFVNHTERETLNRDRNDMTRTDDFLSKHPAMAKQLSENPKLVDDPKYLADHPALNNYLQKNPGIRNEWENHPEAFDRAARADERYNKTGQKPPIAHQERAAAAKK